jgi:hypothetical protein
MKKRNLAYLYALLIASTVGILTVISQKYLPGSLNSLANSGAVWLIPAFFVATLGKRLFASIALCVETLAVCVVSYYAFEAVINSHSFVFSGFAWVWLGCAFVFGVIFGIGAYFYTNKARYYQLGAGLLPAVFLSEGLNELVHLPDYAHMIPAIVGRIVVGIVLYIIIFRKGSLNKKALLCSGILVLLGILGYELIYRLT